MSGKDSLMTEKKPYPLKNLVPYLLVGIISSGGGATLTNYLLDSHTKDIEKLQVRVYTVEIDLLNKLGTISERLATIEGALSIKKEK